MTTREFLNLYGDVLFSSLIVLLYFINERVLEKNIFWISRVYRLLYKTNFITSADKTEKS